MSAARNNRRRHKRRRRFGLLYKLLAIAALAAALLLGATIFFQVEKVVVSGAERYTDQEIIQAAGVSQGDNLFRLNWYEMSRQIRSRLPYIETVNLRPSLPDTLLINVTESRAVAWLAGEEGDWLLSPAGKVLENVPAGTANGICLTGLEPVGLAAGAHLEVPEEQQLRLDGLLALMEVLESRGLTDKVSAIDLSSAARMVMTYDDGRFTVRLPVSGDFDYLIQALEEAIGTLESYETGTMDLTVEDYTVVFSPG